MFTLNRFLDFNRTNSLQDLTQTSKQYTCLILHEKLKNEHALDASDAAKFNLKLSEQVSLKTGFEPGSLDGSFEFLSSLDTFNLLI